MLGATGVSRRGEHAVSGNSHEFGGEVNLTERFRADGVCMVMALREERR